MIAFPTHAGAGSQLALYPQSGVITSPEQED
jgi:hypothetical protein